KGFLFPPSFAAQEGRALITKVHCTRPDHAEDWESTAVQMRTQLQKQVFGDFPRLGKLDAKLGKSQITDGVQTRTLLLYPEPAMPLPAVLKSKPVKGRVPACIVLHLEGKAEALKHPLAAALLDKGWLVIAPDLRGTGETRPAKDAIAGAPDHNTAEHAIWV